MAIFFSNTTGSLWGANAGAGLWSAGSWSVGTWLTGPSPVPVQPVPLIDLPSLPGSPLLAGNPAGADGKPFDIRFHNIGGLGLTYQRRNAQGDYELFYVSRISGEQALVWTQRGRPLNLDRAPIISLEAKPPNDRATVMNRIYQAATDVNHRARMSALVQLDQNGVTLQLLDPVVNPAIRPPSVFGAALEPMRQVLGSNDPLTNNRTSRLRASLWELNQQRREAGLPELRIDSRGGLRLPNTAEGGGVLAAMFFSIGMADSQYNVLGAPNIEALRQRYNLSPEFIAGYDAARREIALGNTISAVSLLADLGVDLMPSGVARARSALSPTPRLPTDGVPPRSGHPTMPQANNGGAPIAPVGAVPPRVEVGVPVGLSPDAQAAYVRRAREWAQATMPEAPHHALQALNQRPELQRPLLRQVALEQMVGSAPDGDAANTPAARSLAALRARVAQQLDAGLDNATALKRLLGPAGAGMRARLVREALAEQLGATTPLRQAVAQQLQRRGLGPDALIDLAASPQSRVALMREALLTQVAKPGAGGTPDAAAMTRARATLEAQLARRTSPAAKEQYLRDLANSPQQLLRLAAEPTPASPPGPAVASAPQPPAQPASTPPAGAAPQATPGQPPARARALPREAWSEAAFSATELQSRLRLSDQDTRSILAFRTVQADWQRLMKQPFDSPDAAADAVIGLAHQMHLRAYGTYGEVGLLGRIYQDSTGRWRVGAPQLGNSLRELTNGSPSSAVRDPNPRELWWTVRPPNAEGVFPGFSNDDVLSTLRSGRTQVAIVGGEVFQLAPTEGWLRLSATQRQDYVQRFSALADKIDPRAASTQEWEDLESLVYEQPLVRFSQLAAPKPVLFDRATATLPPEFFDDAAWNPAEIQLRYRLDNNQLTTMRILRPHREAVRALTERTFATRDEAALAVYQLLDTVTQSKPELRERIELGGRIYRPDDGAWRVGLLELGQARRIQSGLLGDADRKIDADGGYWHTHPSNEGLVEVGPFSMADLLVGLSRQQTMYVSQNGGVYRLNPSPVWDGMEPLQRSELIARVDALLVEKRLPSTSPQRFAELLQEIAQMQSQGLLGRVDTLAGLPWPAQAQSVRPPGALPSAGDGPPGAVSSPTRPPVTADTVRVLMNLARFDPAQASAKQTFGLLADHAYRLDYLVAIARTLQQQRPDLLADTVRVGDRSVPNPAAAPLRALLATTPPTQVPVELQRAFTERRWLRFYERSESKPPSALLAQGLESHLRAGGRGPGVFVDLGSGAGVESRRMLELGWRVLAIDPEAQAIDWLQGRVSAAQQPRLQTQVAGILQAQLPSNADVVFAGTVLPHLRRADVAPALARAAAALKPGGTLVADFFGPQHAFAGSRPDLSLFSADEVRAMLPPELDVVSLRSDGARIELIARRRAK